MLKCRTTIKIGIESQGDPCERSRKRVSESIKLFVSKDCQIIICATHLRNQTVELVKKLTSGYEEIEIIKQRCTNSTMYNSVDFEIANKVAQKVEDIIFNSK